MAVRYRHRQVNRHFLTLFLAIAAVIAGVWFMRPGAAPGAILLIVLALIAVTLAVFCSLTVEIADGTIAWSFGYGVLRRQVPLANIANVTRDTIPWWFGAGVKLGSGTVTYLVAAGPAVTMTLKSGGRTIRIGSDDADTLVAALHAELNPHIPERRKPPG